MLLQSQTRVPPHSAFNTKNPTTNANASRSPSPTRHDFAPSYPPPDWQRPAFPDRGPGAHSEGGAPTTYCTTIGHYIVVGATSGIVLRNAELWLCGHYSPVSSSNLGHPCRIPAPRSAFNATQRNTTTRNNTQTPGLHGDT